MTRDHGGGTAVSSAAETVATWEQSSRSRGASFAGAINPRTTHRGRRCSSMVASGHTPLHAVVDLL